MQEKPDRLFAAVLTQFGSHRDQVQIMDPDDVIRAEELRQCVRKAPVDDAVLVVILLLEMHQVDPVVQDRPQALVGEPVVKTLEFLTGQINRDDIDAVNELDRRLHFPGVGSDLSAPAEPPTTGGLQRFAHCDCEPARLAIAFRIGNAIGHDNQPTFANPFLSDSTFSHESGLIDDKLHQRPKRYGWLATDEDSLTEIYTPHTNSEYPVHQKSTFSRPLLEPGFRANASESRKVTCASWLDNCSAGAGTRQLNTAATRLHWPGTHAALCPKGEEMRDSDIASLRAANQMGYSYALRTYPTRQATYSRCAPLLL